MTDYASESYWTNRHTYERALMDKKSKIKSYLGWCPLVNVFPRPLLLSGLLIDVSRAIETYDDRRRNKHVPDINTDC